MFLPVDRSITLSAPQRMAQTSFSTSSSMLEVTAELPMLALILTLKLRPDGHGLDLGVVDVGGDDGAAAATSSRTNSGVMILGNARAQRVAARRCSRAGSAGTAPSTRGAVLAHGDDSISGVTMPLSGVVHLRDLAPGLARRGLRCSAAASARKRPGGRRPRSCWPSSRATGLRPSSLPVSPRSAIQAPRTLARPFFTSMHSRRIGRGPRCPSR